MDWKFEKSASLKFCAKFGNSATETFNMRRVSDKTALTYTISWSLSRRSIEPKFDTIYVSTLLMTHSSCRGLSWVTRVWSTDTALRWRNSHHKRRALHVHARRNHDWTGVQTRCSSSSSPISSVSWIRSLPYPHLWRSEAFEEELSVKLSDPCSVKISSRWQRTLSPSSPHSWIFSQKHSIAPVTTLFARFSRCRLSGFNSSLRWKWSAKVAV